VVRIGRGRSRAARRERRRGAGDKETRDRQSIPLRDLLFSIADSVGGTRIYLEDMYGLGNTENNVSHEKLVVGPSQDCPG
jgi:hypothetical protein